MSKVANIVEDLRNIEGLVQPAQEQLISGTNIKTINGGSILGSGDIDIITPLNDTLTSTSTTEALTANQGKILQDTKQEQLVSGINIKTVGGQSLLGSGNIPTGTASGFTLLNTIQIEANTSEIQITLDNTYDSIKILMQGVSISSNLNAGVIKLLYSLDGTTYENSSTSYLYTSTSRINVSDYSIPIVPVNAYGGSNFGMDINIYKEGMLQSFVAASESGSGSDIVVGNYNGSVGTGVKKVKIFPSRGVFNAGKIKVIGVKYV